jgi:hypothetical protein
VLGRHAIAETGLYSVCLAIENLWLAATAEGLGVGWVSFYREEFLRQLLHIPTHIRPVAWLCLGPIRHLQTTPDLERHGWRHQPKHASRITRSGAQGWMRYEARCEGLPATSVQLMQHLRAPYGTGGTSLHGVGPAPERWSGSWRCRRLGCGCCWWVWLFGVGPCG